MSLCALYVIDGNIPVKVVCARNLPAQRCAAMLPLTDHGKFMKRDDYSGRAALPEADRNAGTNNDNKQRR